MLYFIPLIEMGQNHGVLLTAEIVYLHRQLLVVQSHRYIPVSG
jgi:hypothetical protein